MKKWLLAVVALGIALGSPALAASKAKAKKVEAPKQAQSVNLLSAGACVVGTVVTLPFALVAAAPKTPNVAKPLTASCPA